MYLGQSKEMNEGGSRDAIGRTKYVDAGGQRWTRQAVIMRLPHLNCNFFLRLVAVPR